MPAKNDSKRTPNRPIWPWEGKLEQLMSCELCGCLVTDAQLHMEFHRRVFTR